jgi:hypothetical protein
VSLVPCATGGCPHRVREGLRNDDWLDYGADGRYCWRCRQKLKRRNKVTVTRVLNKERSEEGSFLCWFMTASGRPCSRCSTKYVNYGKHKDVRACTQHARGLKATGSIGYGEAL